MNVDAVSPRSDGSFVLVPDSAAPGENSRAAVEPVNSQFREPWDPLSRFNAVRSVSNRAQLACPLVVGVYCCGWKSTFERLIPQQKHFGSGVSIKGFDDLKAPSRGWHLSER